MYSMNELGKDAVLTGVSCVLFPTRSPEKEQTREKMKNASNGGEKVVQILNPYILFLSGIPRQPSSAVT